MVAMNVWPTDASDGAVSSEARWRAMARLWTPTGVVKGTGGEMAPTLAFPNLTVKSGAAWVDGHYCELTSDQVLTVTANGIAVVRFDPAANTAELLYRDGVSTPAQSPTGTWEMVVAQIAGSAMTDKRVWADTGRNFAVSSYASALTALPANADVIVQMTTINLDIGGWAKTGDGRLIVPPNAGGYYHFAAFCPTANTAANAGVTGHFQLQLWRSGVVVARNMAYLNGVWAAMTIGGYFGCVAGDQVWLSAMSTAPGTTYIDPAAGALGTTGLNGHRVSP